MTEENEQANIAAPTAKPARLERPARLPRLFLWLVAIAIILVIVAAFAWRLAGNRLLSAALVPGGAFEAAAAGTPYDYGDPASWAARPGGRAPPPLGPKLGNAGAGVEITRKLR